MAVGCWLNRDAEAARRDVAGDALKHASATVAPGHAVRGGIARRAARAAVVGVVVEAEAGTDMFAGAAIVLAHADGTAGARHRWSAGAAVFAAHAAVFDVALLVYANAAAESGAAVRGLCAVSGAVERAL